MGISNHLLQLYPVCAILNSRMSAGYGSLGICLIRKQGKILREPVAVTEYRSPSPQPSNRKPTGGQVPLAG